MYPLKIAFISYEYPPDTVTGGIGTYTYQIARLLTKQNFDVYIFAGSHTQSGRSIENGVTIQRVQCTGPHDFQKNVVPHFEKEHTSQPFYLIESPEIHANALEIKRRFPSIPLNVRLHASNYLVESFKKKYIPLQNKLRFFLGALRRGKWDLGYWRRYDYKNDPDYLFIQLADHITAPTIQMKNWIVKNWNVDPGLVKILENPYVENALFKSAINNNEARTIIFYGRLNVLKGLVTATKAMKRILKDNPSWSWLIIGEDGMAANGKDSMKEWMKKKLKNVQEQVSFYDSVPTESIPRFLQKASVVLIPSLFESYSYVTIEAMCAGKAVIGSEGTGIASLITNNVTGLLADPYSPYEWQGKIQQLINDSTLRKRLGNAACEFVENIQFKNEEIARYYKKLLQEITNSPGCRVLPAS
ncbi:MAG: glycosyltransferase family 4 protein [Ginsengibacter sp.]